MRRFATLLSVVLVAASLALPSAMTPALGAKAPLKCSTKKLEGESFRFCRGKVTSEDGSVRLDTDVTLPAKGDGPFPLIVMNHGLGGTKASYEQRFNGDEEQRENDTIEGTGGEFHYNNAWFASKGYAVLNYTARGFEGDTCLDETVPAADDDPSAYGDSPACLPQADHKDHEPLDTQWLISKLVDRTLLSADVTIDRKAIGVTGVSYGGGHTWLLSRLNRWTTPKGTTVKLAAVVPIIGFTDLVDALSPNGTPHAGLMPPTDASQRLAERPGVPKLAYIDAFFQLINTTSDSGAIPGYLDSWYDRVHEGEPYVDAVSQDYIRSFIENRSAYYVDQVAATVPTLAIQGWTDHVFPAVQSVQMANRLLEGNPDYPIVVLLNDFGHPIAGNPEDDIRYQSGLINTWFKHYLKGKGAEPEPHFESSKTVCEGVEQEDALVSSPEYFGLSSGTEDFALDLTGSLSTSALDEHRNDLNPVRAFGGPRNACRVTDKVVANGNLAATVDLPDGLTMLGLPQVILQADPLFPDLYIAFHLWDVNGEEQTLVDRGVFRLGTDEAQTVVTFLQGNHYEFAAGHQLKLELTANDSPSFEASTAVGLIDISDVNLSIPTAAAE
jgi:predicted acyl esterase